jgi:hypothetical protein
MEPVQLAAILATVVVVASMLSVELGIAVALFELGLGVIVGNVFDLEYASALIPTAIAQTLFHPIADLERRGRPVPAEEYV